MWITDVQHFQQCSDIQWLWLEWFNMDHPTLPDVGKNCELIWDQYFGWLGQIWVLSVLQNKITCKWMGICIYKCSFNNWLFKSFQLSIDRNMNNRSECSWCHRSCKPETFMKFTTAKRPVDFVCATWPRPISICSVCSSLKKNYNLNVHTRSTLTEIVCLSAADQTNTRTEREFWVTSSSNVHVKAWEAHQEIVQQC